REWTKEANQVSSPIALVGGRRYYIEALMKEGAGGDNLAVRWQLPNGTIEEPIPGSRMLPALSAPQILAQPNDVTVSEGFYAIFTVVVTNQAQITYQWLLNGTPIPGANRATLVINPVSQTNNGDSYSCLLTNALGTLMSSNALLTVTPFVREGPQAPLIDSFLPTSGPVGTEVTITGANFSSIPSSNIVYFGPVRAMVTSASTNALVVLAPPGTSYQPFTVTTAGRTGTAKRPFVGTFFGVSSPQFEGRRDFSSAQANPFAIGDLDGDGRPDVAMLATFDGGVGGFLLFQNASTGGTLGHGSLGPGTALSGNYPGIYAGGARSVVLADIDGDGKLDLIETVWWGEMVIVFRNLGAPGGAAAFAPAVLLNVPGLSFSSGALAVGDIDGDGRPEILVLGYSSGIYVLKNLTLPGTVTSNSFAAPAYLLSASFTNAYAIALGDLDGDGKLDVAALTGNGVRLLRNTSTVPLINPSTLANPVALDMGGDLLALGDMDGDGRLDLVTSGGYPKTKTTILRNLTLGPGLDTNSFGEKVELPGLDVTNPGTIALGDLNGDGKVDLVVTSPNNSGQSLFSIILNQGSPGSLSTNSFAPALPFSFYTRNAFSVAIADLDLDGRPDIILAPGDCCPSADYLSVYYNTTPAPPDVPPSVTISLPTNGATFTAPASISLTANASDADGTVAQVIFFANGALLGKSTNGPYSLLWTNVMAGAYTLTASAIDNVGVASTSAPVNITVYPVPTQPPPTINNFSPSSGPIGSFVTLSGANFSPALADNIVYFGAVRATVISATANSLVVSVPSGATYQPITVTTAGLTGVAKRPFTLTFPAGPPFQFDQRTDYISDPLSAGRLQMGDLDGDGRPDVALLGTFSGVGGFGLLNNNSTPGPLFTSLGGLLQLFTPLAGANNAPRGSVLADLDGDGRLDLLLYENQPDQVVIFHNISTNGGALTAASFEKALTIPVPSLLASGGICVADLDGDGRLDIILTRRTSVALISVLQNLTSPGLIASNSFSAPIDFFFADLDSPQGLAVADFDLDGRPDVAAIGDWGVRMLRNTSTGNGINNSTLGAPVTIRIYPPGNEPMSFAAADIDGDGRPDLVSIRGTGLNVLRNLTTGPGIGSNSFAAPIQFSASQHCALDVNAIQMADMNGDAKVDLVVFNQGTDCGSTGSFSVFLNTSSPGAINTSSFGPRMDFPLNDIQSFAAGGLLLADVDGDGRMDVLVSRSRTNSNVTPTGYVSVYHNGTPPPPDIPPVVAISAPTNGAGFLGPANIAITVAASDSDGSVAQVILRSGGEIIGILTNAPYNFLWTNVSVGSYTLTAVAVDDSGSSTVSDAISIHVNAPPTPPTITSQPQSQSAQEGSNATFTVGVTGTIPMSFKWVFNGASNVGANSNSLRLQNISFGNTGTYSVIVSNAGGSVTSAPAILTVLPIDGRLMQIGSASAAPGGTVTVPIYLIGQGNENAVQFSINFGPSALSYVGPVQLGLGGSGAVLNVNEAQASVGRLGVSLALGGGGALPAGTQEVVLVTFNVAPGVGNSTVAISFGDQPLGRDVSDSLANELQASYLGSIVTIQGGGYEADVTPAPDGNGAVSVTDWIKVGRYAAGLDTGLTPAQFQRADCAPRATLGNGVLSLTDWVQAGRYAAGLDPLTEAGGPTGPLGSLAAKSLTLVAKATSGERQVIIPKTGLQAGQTNRVPVWLVAQGNESAIGFSVHFDPSVLAFVSGSAGINASSAVFNVNSAGSSTGLVGIALTLPIGTNTFQSGTQEVAALTFVTAPNATGASTILFEDHPALREVSDPFANSLAASFTANGLFVMPRLKITPAGTSHMLTWPAWASNAVVETAAKLPPNATWNPSSITTSNIVAGEIRVTIPATSSQNFFRLRFP
ncbi:MAG: hypothetical protein JWM16_484, partial [Verrucomicrobiales bacterium]|nr:hypothetical protein [Verrucomicrobiales bacterium]